MGRGGGALRTFRLAGFILDSVSFDSRVSGVVGATAVASIFLWTSGYCGVVLGDFLWTFLGVPQGHLGVLWGWWWHI